MAALSLPRLGAAVPFSRRLRGARTGVSCRDFSLKLFDHPRQIGVGASLVLRPEIGAGVLDRAPLPYAAINCLPHSRNVLSLPAELATKRGLAPGGAIPALPRRRPSKSFPPR